MEEEGQTYIHYVTLLHYTTRVTYYIYIYVYNDIYTHIKILQSASRILSPVPDEARNVGTRRNRKGLDS